MENKIGTLKAQFWSFDVIFAVIIFSFVITIIAYTWFSLSNQLSISYGNGPGIMQIQLQSLSQNLFSYGSPSNWQSTVDTRDASTWSGIFVGLGSSQYGNELSSSKIYTLMSMANSNYIATKQALGVGFDYYITIKSAQNIGSGININIGKNPLNYNARTIYVNNEFGTMDGVPVTIGIMLWTNTTIATS